MKKSIKIILIFIIFLGCNTGMNEETINMSTVSSIYSLAWKQGFYRGISKNDWNQETWKLQFTKDSLNYINEVYKNY